MKRVISLALVLAMLLGTLAVNALAQDFEIDATYTLGDVNDDGAVDASDALAAQRYLSGAADAAIVRDALDLDADGNATAYDTYLLKQCLANARSLSEFDNGTALFLFTIGGNPISTYSLVVPADTDAETSNALFAAEELQKYTKIATGVELPICFGTYSTENAVFFHQYDENSPEGAEFGVEGFRYEVADGQLNVYGTRRGNMYAVYEILEEYVGFRFYNRERSMIYKNRTVDLPEGTYVDRVYDVSYRHVSHTFIEGAWKNDGEGAKAYYVPRRLNGTQIATSPGWRYGTQTGPHFINAHSFYYYYQMNDGVRKYILTNGLANSGDPDLMKALIDENGALVADAPDLYSTMLTGDARDILTWQPCFTSEESYQQMFWGMFYTIKMITVQRDYVLNPKTSAMSFSINDNVNYCSCANCSTLYASDGYSGGSVYMANRAIRDLQEYYPGLKLFFILYDFVSCPRDIFPEKDLIIAFCGQGCNNHPLGTAGCGDDMTLLGTSNIRAEKAMKAWGDMCNQTGTELWFWYYPVNYYYFLVDTPNLFNVYDDFNYVINECGFTGVYYEGSNGAYTFESLKAYLASRFLESPDMPRDAFVDIMKEYLYMNYGDGAEEIFRFLQMENTAGDLAGCFLNNFDRPARMFDSEYLAEHYEEMRALLVTAWEKAKATGTYDQAYRVETILNCFEFLGLSTVQAKYYWGVDIVADWLNSRADGTQIASDILFPLRDTKNNTDELGAELYQMLLDDGVTPELLTRMMSPPKVRSSSGALMLPKENPPQTPWEKGYLALLDRALAECDRADELEASRALFRARYDDMLYFMWHFNAAHNYIAGYGYVVVYNPMGMEDPPYKLPATADYDRNLMYQFYGHERDNVKWP